MSLPIKAFALRAPLQFVKRPIPNFNLNDGGAYVLDLCATWCPPCRHVFPHLSEYQAKYPQIKLIGISEESEDVFAKFAAKPENNMNFHVAVDTEGGLDEYRSFFKVRGIPHCFIIVDNQVIFSGHPLEPSFATKIEEAANKVDAASGKIDFSQLTKDEIKDMKISELKDHLRERHVDFSDCFEKSDFLERVYTYLGYKKE